jgi:two-component system invasion response regulator UvrY
MSQQATKVLIVTDMQESSDELQKMLSGAPDMSVVGVAGTGENAITQADLHQPDMVVMDYDMPGLNGAEATRTILHNDDRIQVIMLSVVNDVEDIRAAMRAGARDYLIKPLADGELLETIRWLLRERREYARMQAFVGQLRKSYEALFRDDKPVPPTVVTYLESQVQQSPGDRLVLETLAVAYARNRDWKKLAPLMSQLTAISG